MANYSDIFPLNVSGGGSIGGFTWTEKTSDFTAVANEAYYCDTALGDILMTLPSNPSPGDEVAFFMIGNNKVNITTTEKVKGVLLAVDYGKQAQENYIIFILNYVDSITGWDWHSRYNPYVIDTYLGDGTLLPYSSVSTLNGLVDWLGTNKGLSSYQNVYPTYFNFTASIPFTANTTSQSLVFDKTVYTGNASVSNSTPGTPAVSSHSPGDYYQIDLLVGTIEPSHIFVPLVNNNTSSTRSIKIKGGLAGNYQDIQTYAIPPSTNDSARIITYSGGNAFDSFRVVFNYSATQGLPLSEFEVWGTYLG